jgi:hypothetical protein
MAYHSAGLLIFIPITSYHGAAPLGGWVVGAHITGAVGIRPGVPYHAVNSLGLKL